MNRAISSPWSVAARSLTVWLVIIAAETLHGIARTLLLQPAIGDFRARQVAVFTGSLMILAIAFLTVRWIGAAAHGRLLGVGVLWVVLTIAFEIGLGRFVLGLSWERLASDYDIRIGGLLGIGMVILLFAPLLAVKIRGRLRV